MHLVFAVLLAVTQQWLVVSDLHVDPFDRNPEPAPYQQDTNWPLFDASLAQMRKAMPNPDIVVLAGDFLAHEFGSKVRRAGTRASVSTEALATMTRIERSFANAFPRAQFLVALGNNDDPCGDYRTAPNTPYLARLARIWAPLVNRRNSAPRFVRDFSHAGSYTAHISPQVRAVVVDDVPWSFVFRGCGSGAGALPVAQMNWLTNQLRGTPAGTRDIVVLHIPPGVDASTTLLAQRFLVVPFLRDDFTARLTNVLGTNADRVAFLIAGHTHRLDFRVAGGVPALLAPAVSPIYSNNPAFLTLHVDPDGPLRDYQMYAGNLYSDTWSQVFDFDAVFGVDGFTAKNLALVHARIPANDDMQERWERAIVAYSPEKNVRKVWRAFWCAQTELRSGYAACAGDQRRVIVLRVAIALLALGIVLALALLAMRLARQRRRA
jgi:predicted phosphodiesterase